MVKKIKTEPFEPYELDLKDLKMYQVFCKIDYDTYYRNEPELFKIISINTVIQSGTKLTMVTGVDLMNNRLTAIDADIFKKIYGKETKKG